MTVSLHAIMNRLPAERRASIDARAAQLIAEELTLRQLREACKITQEQLAERLGVRQESISGLEKRSDMLLSTLRDVITAMGGTLSLNASFGDGASPKSIRGGNRRTLSYDIFKDAAGVWRWHLRDDTGRIVMTSAEGHKLKSHCVADINQVKRLLAVGVDLRAA